MRLVWRAASILGALALAPTAASSQTSSSPSTAPIAQLGIALPAIGGIGWPLIRRRFFTPAVMRDIHDNLHASFVRVGWRPDGLRVEQVRWHREDQALDTICSSGLQVMILVPNPNDDHLGEQHLIDAVGEFFARYTRREFGCLRYAEIANEADLRTNGFASVSDYAAYYKRVAPAIAAFGIAVITSGTSGKDVPWTVALASILRSADPSPPVSGYGFHPYGVPPDQMAEAVEQLRDAIGNGRDGMPPNVYVTEIGKNNATDLYQTIVRLAPVTPAITIYEYMAQPHEDPEYGLRDNPALYEAVRRAGAAIAADR
jgi:hypothetical protein